ncbi:hypothetical protein DVR12_22380 [Chitinophaga silvatica]|uniref:Anti-sigma K factor RskA C-terminal domain-containing protein n=1 Tax=Chitinophaga silvatica TaxID=2282649 RepID=A0A3E1Y579_9BACT|nr:anti-sigma factor [Chitinophaga silvatica]RFS19841.1 hypothetical protein DVR12_22380 [Chitinophaga silvatica]
MDVQHYISSGILESYVFGMLPEEEQIEVEIAALQYPDIRAAVRALQQEKERFVQLYAITPPSVIKEKILAIIHEEEAAAGNSMELQPKPSLSDPTSQQQYKLPSSNHHTIKPKPIIHKPASKSSSDLKWKYATAAIIIVLVGSVLLNFFFFNASNDYEGRYKELIATREKLDEQKEQQNQTAYQSPSNNTNSSLKDPDFKLTHLEGTSNYEGSSIDIGWNNHSNAVLLLAQLMPLPPNGKQFHLWAIHNSTFKDAGVFNTGANMTKVWQQMKEIKNADSFIISLQTVGSTTPPAKEEIIMSGHRTQ